MWKNSLPSYTAYQNEGVWREGERGRLVLNVLRKQKLEIKNKT